MTIDQALLNQIKELRALGAVHIKLPSTLEIVFVPPNVATTPEVIFKKPTDDPDYFWSPSTVRDPDEQWSTFKPPPAEKGE